MGLQSNFLYLRIFNTVIVYKNMLMASFKPRTSVVISKSDHSANLATTTAHKH